MVQPSRGRAERSCTADGDDNEHKRDGEGLQDQDDASSESDEQLTHAATSDSAETLQRQAEAMLNKISKAVAEFRKALIQFGRAKTTQLKINQSSFDSRRSFPGGRGDVNYSKRCEFHPSATNHTTQECRARKRLSRPKVNDSGLAADASARAAASFRAPPPLLPPPQEQDSEACTQSQRSTSLSARQHGQAGAKKSASKRRLRPVLLRTRLLG